MPRLFPKKRRRRRRASMEGRRRSAPASSSAAPFLIPNLGKRGGSKARLPTSLAAKDGMKKEAEVRTLCFVLTMYLCCIASCWVCVCHGCCQSIMLHQHSYLRINTPGNSTHCCCLFPQCFASNSCKPAKTGNVVVALVVFRSEMTDSVALHFKIE